MQVYLKRGLDTPKRVAGPFSWLLWDERRQSLVAARDRMGCREIYYAIRNADVYFSEEADSLLQTISGASAPNPRAVLAHIHGQFLAPGETFYSELHSLQPGDLLFVTRQRVEIKSYWRPELQPTLRLSGDEEYAAAFRERVCPVVAEYAPKPSVGVTLSSGLDSTTVAASLRIGIPQGDFTAFLWASPELPQADESHEALEVARLLSFHPVVIPADQHWTLRRDPGIRPPREGPQFNMFSDALEALFQAARERGITSLLTGLGGDSLFGESVFSYPDLLLTGRWRTVISEVRQHLPHSHIGLRGIIRQMILGPVAQLFFPSHGHRVVEKVPWLDSGVPYTADPTEVDLPRWVLPGRKERLRILRGPTLPAMAQWTTAHARRCGIDLLHPLSDHRVIELALSLPSTQTFRAAQRKVIVRNAMRGLLPDSIVERRDKIYPAAIAHRGLRERETAKVWALMTNMRAAEMGFVNEQRLREEYQRYLDGKTQSTLFWHTLTLEAWLRLYF